jgi:hypothetical protein
VKCSSGRLGNSGRPSWRPVVEVVLSPLWHQGHKGVTYAPDRRAGQLPQDRGRGPQAPVAAPTGSATSPVGRAGVIGAARWRRGSWWGRRDPGAAWPRKGIAPRPARRPINTVGCARVSAPRAPARMVVPPGSWRMMAWIVHESTVPGSVLRFPGSGCWPWC